MVAYTVKLNIDRGRTINRWNLASPLSNTLPVLKVFSYPFFLLPGFNANVFVTAFLALPIKPLIVPVYSLLSPSCKTIELRACDQFGALWSHYIMLTRTVCVPVMQATKPWIRFPTPWKTLMIKFPPLRDGKDVKNPGYARGGGGGAC